MGYDMATGTALIVGASRGLGLGLTERFLERGWTVTSTSRGAGAEHLTALAEGSDGQLALSHTLLLIAPGWVQTELGGPDASLTVEQSTRGVADVIEAQAGRGGLHYVDHHGATVPW